MPPNTTKQVTVKRPDGTTLAVPEDQAGRLEVLGYQRETPEERLSRTSAQDTQDYYDTFGQKVTTGLEGALSGATLGLSDPVLSSLGDEHIAGRAQHHPGIRLGSEVLGAIGASLYAGPAGAADAGATDVFAGGVTDWAASDAVASAGSRIAAKTPAGALSNALEGQNILARGAVEGAAYGAGGQVSRSTLTDDPFTAEAVLSSIGWGTLYGSGLSALGAGIGKVAGKVGEHLEAVAKEAPEALGADASEMIPQEHWTALRNEAKNLSSVAHEASESVKDSLNQAVDNMADYGTNQFRGIKPQGDFVLERAVANATGTGADSVVRKTSMKAVQDIRGAYRLARTAVEAGDKGSIDAALANYRVTVENWAFKLNAPIKMPPVDTLMKASAIEAGTKAFQHATDLASISDTLDSFPKSPKDWVAMPASSAEALHAALDKASKIDVPELGPAQAQLKEAMTGVAQKLGMSETEPVAAMRSAWKTLREADSKRTLSAIDGIVRGGDKAPSGGGVIAGMLAYKGAKAVGKFLGLSSMGSYGVYRGLKGLMKGAAGEITGLRGLVSSKLKTAVEGMSGAGGLLEAGGGAIGSKIDPLRTRLDGTKDDAPAKNRNELFARRKAEITGATNSVHDTLYRAVQPIHQSEPAVARAVHAAAVNAFKAVYDAMPKTNGMAFSLFKPLGGPDPVALERFARVYSMLQDPHGNIDRMYSGAQAVTADHSKAQANMWPAMTAELRAHQMESLADPATKAQMQGNYRGLHSQSLLLGIPLHSTSTPEFIAAQQAMFSQRNPPAQADTGTKPGQSSSGGGRPAATQSQGTQAQISTER